MTRAATAKFLRVTHGAMQTVFVARATTSGFISLTHDTTQNTFEGSENDSRHHAAHN
jgi:hypothetical protein